MALYAYIRVSTQAQSYDSQLHRLREYFEKSGIDINKIKLVEEKITSRSSYRDRTIFPILRDSQPGDIIYACQLDRFGRSVDDIIQLVKFADSIGVTLWSIKENMQITYKTQTGKILLTMLAMAAEIERELKAEQCLAGTQAAREEIKKNGYRIAHSSGKIQTRWGNEKGCDMSAAQEASAEARANAAIHWKEQSIGFDWVRLQLAKGKPRALIIEEFNELHVKHPDTYCTREGKPLSKGVLSKWVREINSVAL